jgi:hypothetical protein
MINTFNELLAHAGHKVEIVYYGTEHQAVNAAIECITCGCVLVDLSPGDLLNKEIAEDVDKTIAHVWHIDDVIAQARKRHINLSEKQAKEILHRIDKGKAADIGINWDVIDSHIDGYFKTLGIVQG